MARSFGPSCSMGCDCSRWRVARKFGQPFSFSSTQAFAKLPLRISARILRISSRVCLVMMRGPSGVVALLGGIADGVAHVAQAAAVDQVNDELEFVHAFEVGDLGLVAGFGERFESGFDQFADAAAEYGLFAEEIGFGFFGKRGFEDAGARAAESLGVGKSECFRLAAGILFDGEERGRSAAFGEDFANAVAWSFRSNHGDINAGRRLDGAEANVEAVREHQRLAGLEIRLDGVAVELGLLRVRNENHDDVGPSRGFGGRVDGQAFLLGFGARGAAFVKSDADGDAAVAQDSASARDPASRSR